MRDLSGYVRKPSIRLEPKGTEPAEVYCKKYATLYQEIADKLNGGEPIGSSVEDASGMYLLYVRVENGQINFSGHESENRRNYDPVTKSYIRGFSRARPFSILEEIAAKAGFTVKVEVAQPFMEEKYHYKPKPGDLDGDHSSKVYCAPVKPMSQRKPSHPALPAIKDSLTREPDTGYKNTDTAVMPRFRDSCPPVIEFPGIHYLDIETPTDPGTETQMAARPGFTPQGSQSSPGQLN